jgi:rare lipoprotein A
MIFTKDYQKNRLLSAPRHLLFIACSCALLMLGACSSTPKGRYHIAQDTAPSFDYGEIEYYDVIPKPESHNKWTSKPYDVMGIRYYPMASAYGFEEEGSASWYGEKFHGHKTANGEIFNMFGLTAAHKTLPLPSFVKVSNLSNGKSAIIRVNDRGPFYGDRVIDLSYGAAKKLGYHKYGVANVKLEVLHVNEAGEIRVGSNTQLYNFENGELIAKLEVLPMATALIKQTTLEDATTIALSPGLFVQVMAMKNGKKAKDLATGLSNLLQVPNTVPKIADIYRLQLGPIDTEQKAKNIIQELRKIGFSQAFTVEVQP